MSACGAVSVYTLLADDGATHLGPFADPCHRDGPHGPDGHIWSRELPFNAREVVRPGVWYQLHREVRGPLEDRTIGEFVLARLAEAGGKHEVRLTPNDWAVACQFCAEQAAAVHASDTNGGTPAVTATNAHHVTLRRYEPVVDVSCPMVDRQFDAERNITRAYLEALDATAPGKARRHASRVEALRYAVAQLATVWSGHPAYRAEWLR